MENHPFPRKIGRRDFLKKTGQAMVALGGLELLTTSGFASAQEKGKKILPPETGCYWGYFRDQPQKKAYEDWMAKTGAQPKFTVFPPDPGTPDWKPKEFRKDLLDYIASFNPATPIVYRLLTGDIKEHGFSNLVTSKEFQQDITRYAQAITEYKKPFFFDIMPQINADWFSWGRQPKTAKEVWKYIWQIFEDNGANQYATWTIEFKPTERFKGNQVDLPERYYPGDQYVHWIGFSVYSRILDYAPEFDTSFNNLCEGTIKSAYRDHKNKPLMIEELGKTRAGTQPRWFKNAFETIKSWPEIKAAIVWDVYDIGLRDDANLSDDTLKMLGQIFKDPYFIGAK